MGVAVSSWKLAREVSSMGQLGVVSGTGLDAVLSRRLQMGDPGGFNREAMRHFPIPSMATRVWHRYYVEGGKAEASAFKSKPLPSVELAGPGFELTLVAAFVEVWLAKQGHQNPVGINLLEKIQLPTLPTLYGAMLAGVDVVLMGAGIPRAIPAILDRFARGERAELSVEVAGGDPIPVFLDPAQFDAPALRRPKFFAIVSSASLAVVLAKKCHPPVDGFIVEGHRAGGHNAPPRSATVLSEEGEPIYGERDVPDLAKFRELGLPFWLAGSYGAPESLRAAKAEGACGVQVGTAFAFCNESGMIPELKANVIGRGLKSELSVFTDPLASPTGFPFKVVQLEGTASESSVANGRQRVCDLGYLRETYRDADGKIGFRCPAEPPEDYVRKGGNLADTVGRKCICNGLLATVGLPQVRHGVAEPALVTAGDDVTQLNRYMAPGAQSYSARDVIETILASH